MSALLQENLGSKHLIRTFAYILFAVKISKAVFKSSCTEVAKKPAGGFPEFAFIGRSNVGKSSLINMLCGNKQLAKTSSTPGKTLLINYFLINDKLYIVDLPGYGYARIKQTEREKLNRMITSYCGCSLELKVLFVLMDLRLPVQKIDLEFLEALEEANVPCALVFTKADKLGTNARAAQLEKNKKELLEHFGELPPVFCTSSQSSLGKEELLAYIEYVAGESELDKQQH